MDFPRLISAISPLTAQFLIIWKTDHRIVSRILFLRVLWVKNNTQTVVQQLEPTAQMEAHVDDSATKEVEERSGR